MNKTTLVATGFATVVIAALAVNLISSDESSSIEQVNAEHLKTHSHDEAPTVIHAADVLHKEGKDIETDSLAHKEDTIERRPPPPPIAAKPRRKTDNHHPQAHGHEAHDHNHETDVNMPPPPTGAN